MNRKQATELINDSSPDVYLSRAKKKGYICPVNGCGNGTGKDGDGITEDPHSPAGHRHYKCHKCGLYADNIDLIKEYYNLKDFNEAFNKGCEIYGITVDEYDTSKATAKHNTPATEQGGQGETETQEVEADHAEDLKKWYENMQEENNAGLLYLQGRGLSAETINRFKIGYCENWKHPDVIKKHPNIPASPRIIIPTSRYSYLARDIRTDIPADAKKYAKSKAGKVRIFNTKALDNAETPVFVVEGEIDALSIIEAGGQAVALGSTAYVQLFLNTIKKYRIITPVIVALDNDEAGRKATETLTTAFKKRGIEHYTLNPCGTYNDANDALTASRESFIQTVQAIAENPAKWEYERNSVEKHISDFLGEIDKSVNTPAIPTGFTVLDTVLDGGLFEGLYIAGAISSLGKTSFILQVADQIAQQGQDVLYISLEMARSELMAKSISRHTIQRVIETGGNRSDAKTARDITQGAKWQYYSREEKTLIANAINDYAEYAGHLYIYEGVGDIGVKEIADITNRHISITGNYPVVILDYLQILAPYNERYSDKQNVDKAVLELKRLSREHKIPVIAISSFNRDNYKSAVSMQAFKESGAVEYGSDVLLGLQIKGAGDKGFDDEKLNEALANEPREIELKILKNRNGGRPKGALEYEYYPIFNYFKENQSGNGSSVGKTRIRV